jgi:hypothetical protein
LEDNIKIGFKGIGYEGLHYLNLVISGNQIQQIRGARNISHQEEMRNASYFKYFK